MFLTGGNDLQHPFLFCVRLHHASILLAQAVHESKAGKVEYRVDKTAIIHCPIGKASFTEQQLGENLRTLMDAVIKAKPATAKGTYIRSAVVSSTMGPGVKLNTLKF